MQVHLESLSQLPPLGCALEESLWFAVHTMARHEKRVAAQFEEKRVSTFLPLLRQSRRWSDRRVIVELPMFSCYAFVRIVPTVEERLKVLRTRGVLGIVGSEGQGSPIPEDQIESIRIATSKNISCFPHVFINVGRRVRIRGGALEGVEGILVQHGKDQSLVVSVELLQRSVAIRVAGYDIDLV
jgi:transcription antitermination factor NusG